MWTCYQCGRHMLDSDYHWENDDIDGWYCSRSCLHEALAEQKSMYDEKCPWCGRTFNTANGEGHFGYCSQACYNAAKPSAKPQYVNLGARPSINIPGGFCWSVNNKFSAVNVTYGWLENVGDKESKMINIEISGGATINEFSEKYTIANQLLPGHALRGGNCTIQLPRRIKEKDWFKIAIVFYDDKDIGGCVFLPQPDGLFHSSIILSAGWTKKQLKEATKPVAVQIEPPASKKTAAPQPVVTKDTPVDAAPKGSDTKVTITGASYSYSSGKCTLKASRVQNDANHGTGSLKIVFWFSTGGQYNGGTLNGYQMAESLIGNPLGQGLSKGFGYPDVNVTATLTGNPPKGSYQPVITINEKCEDGKWYIVGWANFANPQQWN